MGERQTEVSYGYLKSGGPVFDPQNSHLLIIFCNFWLAKYKEDGLNFTLIFEIIQFEDYMANREVIQSENGEWN